MMRVGTILLFFFIYQCAVSQTAFTFTIADSKTKEVIPFAYTVIKGKTTSAQSNENGKTEIKVNDGDTLVIYQLGYNLYRTTKANISNNGNIVYLVAKSIILDEVVVSTKRTDTFMYRNDVAFLALEFYDDNILTIAAKGGKYNTLMMLDVNGNKLAERKLNIETETIFKDCFDNLHLITKDSIYQVYFNYQDIILLPPFHIRNYYGLLKPCECIHFNTYVFKQKQYRDLKNLYYLFDSENTPQKSLLVTVADSVAIKAFNMDFDINYFLSLRRKGAGYATSVTELSNHLDELRETVQLPPNYLLAPVESEMKKLDTSFVLFDHTNKFVHTFSLKGKPISKLVFTSKYDIDPKLYIDHDTRYYIFSSMGKSGKLTLYRYNAVKNQFTHKFELPSFYFIKHFRPKANNLYLIYKDRNGATTKTKIFKQVIQWEKL